MPIAQPKANKSLRRTQKVKSEKEKKIEGKESTEHMRVEWKLSHVVEAMSCQFLHKIFANSMVPLCYEDIVMVVNC